jgi:hypothetical protein
LRHRFFRLLVGLLIGVDGVGHGLQALGLTGTCEGLPTKRGPENQKVPPLQTVRDPHSTHLSLVKVADGDEQSPTKTAPYTEGSGWKVLAQQMSDKADRWNC